MTCGHLVGLLGGKSGDTYGMGRRALVKGALGAHAPQILEQHFKGRGYGTNGGAFIWVRRPMNAEELEVTARALATATETVIAQIGEGLISAQQPEAVLAELEDDAEAATVGEEWIAEAIAEVERRRRVVADDQDRRALDRERW